MTRPREKRRAQTSAGTTQICRRVQLVREEGTRRVQLVREGRGGGGRSAGGRRGSGLGFVEDPAGGGAAGATVVRGVVRVVRGFVRVVRGVVRVVRGFVRVVRGVVRVAMGVWRGGQRSVGRMRARPGGLAAAGLAARRGLGLRASREAPSAFE